jgi:cytochrome c peroxidase
MNLPTISISPLLILENSNYATMRFEPEASHGANNGLHVARAIMEEIKKEFEWISYGDLWTLGGVAAVQVCL